MWMLALFLEVDRMETKYIVYIDLNVENLLGSLRWKSNKIFYNLHIFINGKELILVYIWIKFTNHGSLLLVVEVK